MSDIPSISSGAGTLEQSKKNPTQILGSLLQKGGFQVTPEELSHIDEAIQRNPSLLESINIDIAVTQTNPNEKSRFETMYLKGSGVLTIDGKNVSFTEFLTKYPNEQERDDILGKMDEKTEDTFRKWEVSIKKNESNKLDGALNQKLNETEQQTKKLVDHARSLMDTGSNEFVTRELNQIQSDPTGSPIAQDLIKRGSTIEDIQSGRLNSTIEAYIISNNKESLTPKDPQKALVFSRVVREMGYITGVKPTPEIIDTFAASKVLGTDRERIVSSMHQIGASGKYDRMTWDSETRSIIFHGESGTRILDTASIPPRERIMKNGLSIGRNIEPISSEQSEKQQLQIESTKIINIVSKDAKDLRMSDPTTIPQSMKTSKESSIKSYQEAQEKYKNAKNPTEKLATLSALKIQNQELEKSRRSTMTTENMDDPKYEKLEKELYDELSGLNRLNDSLDRYIGNSIKLARYQNIDTPKLDTFDTTARDNLDWLIYNRFDRMGPDATEILNRIITDTNRNRTTNNQIDLTKPLDTRDDGPILIGILRKLGGTPDIFTDGKKMPIFQRNMSASLVFPPSDSRSIEAMIRKSTTSPTQT